MIKKLLKYQSKYRNNFVKPNNFYAKKRRVNCGKSGHFSKNCKRKPSNLKNKFNILNIDNSSDIKIGSRGSCCNVIRTNVLTKSKEDKTLEKFNKKKSK